MGINFDDVCQLEKINIEEGKKWVYIADFNIKHEGNKLKSTDRIDVEIDDLKQLMNQGAKTAILAHKGRFKDKDNEDLDFIVPCLSEKLGTNVKYFPENNTENAVNFVKELKPGQVAIMGNTRFHEGEEKNNPKLAEQFAELSDFVAVGGFGKAHREHASNVGILEYLPGYATRSQLREMMLLSPWAGKDEKKYSVAVLGGIKKEKIITGLEGFSKIYDAVIPGGIVMNTILKVLGYEIGDSIISDGGKSFEGNVEKILKEYDFDKKSKILHPKENSERRAEIYLPETVIIAYNDEDKGWNSETRNISDNSHFPAGYPTVDFELSDAMKSSLGKLANEGGRIIIAGTPSIYTEGFKSSTDPILDIMKNNKDKIKGIVLGGDSAAELKYEPFSTGGGSALYFVVNGTTPVFEALKANKKRFS